MSDFDEKEASAFNNGLGIHYILSFKATFPPGETKKPGVVLCKLFYCHECTYIAVLLDVALDYVQEKRNRPDKLDFKIVGGNIRRNFDVTWSSGGSKKGILDTAANYTDMIRQCTGEIALCIEEHDIIEVDDDEEMEKGCIANGKQVNFTTKQKEDSARCTGLQITLAPLQLRSWTGTMVANNPTEEPPLDTSSHVGNERPPYIVVNLTGTSNQASVIAPTSICPKLSLSDFGDKYGLSFGILCKLKESDITGPHGLRFLSATELRNEVGLTIGEYCDVLDALERWTKGIE